MLIKLRAADILIPESVPEFQAALFATQSRDPDESTDQWKFILATVTALQFAAQPHFTHQISSYRLTNKHIFHLPQHFASSRHTRLYISQLLSHVKCRAWSVYL